MILVAFFALVALVAGWPCTWRVDSLACTLELWGKEPPGDWRHYVRTFDGFARREYVDGVARPWGEISATVWVA